MFERTFEQAQVEDFENPGTFQTVTRTTETASLIDPHNGTGLPQAIEEIVRQVMADGSTPMRVRRVFTIGHDVVGQFTSAALQPIGENCGPSSQMSCGFEGVPFGNFTLLGDGHGSTRILWHHLPQAPNDSPTNFVRQKFFYDAYGQILSGLDAAQSLRVGTLAKYAGTPLLYAGEPFHTGLAGWPSRDGWVPQAQDESHSDHEAIKARTLSVKQVR